MALSAKQQAFVEHYLVTWNASEAARRAGYKTKPNVQGARMLANASISAAVQARLAELKMSADEVLTRLSAQARGSLEDFLRIERVLYHPRQAVLDPTEDNPKAVRWVEDPIPVERLLVTLDLEQARDRKKLALLKKLKWNQWGEPEIEIYDSQAALALLGRYHGLFVERQEMTVDFIGDAAASAERKLLAGLATEAAQDDPGDADAG